MKELSREISNCRRCPRLVEHREAIALKKTPRFADWDYWGQPVPAFGESDARLVIIGLAPAAHGANRTGRMFTGDRSGDWLYRALHRFGFASQAESVSRDDGLRPSDCYITAAVHCAPPDNKPTREEKEACRGFLIRELEGLRNARVVVALGRIAFDTYLKTLAERGHAIKPRPVFGHAKCHRLPGGLTLIGSYHPSQQNTFTGRLTEAMFDDVFKSARKILDSRRQS